LPFTRPHGPLPCSHGQRSACCVDEACTLGGQPAPALTPSAAAPRPGEAGNGSAGAAAASPAADSCAARSAAAAAAHAGAAHAGHERAQHAAAHTNGGAPTRGVRAASGARRSGSAGAATAPHGATANGLISSGSSAPDDGKAVTSPATAGAPGRPTPACHQAGSFHGPFRVGSRRLANSEFVIEQASSPRPLLQRCGGLRCWLDVAGGRGSLRTYLAVTRWVQARERGWQQCCVGGSGGADGSGQVQLPSKAATGLLMCLCSGLSSCAGARGLAGSACRGVCTGLASAPVPSADLASACRRQAPQQRQQAQALLERRRRRRWQVKAQSGSAKPVYKVPSYTECLIVTCRHRVLL